MQQYSNDTITQNFQEVVESVQECYLLLSMDFTIIDLSAGFIKYNGSTKQNIIGNKIFDVFPYNQLNFLGDEVQTLQKSIQNSFQGIREEVKINQSFKIIKNELGNPLSADRFFSYENWPVCGTKNEGVQIIHHLVDITELKKIEEKCSEGKNFHHQESNTIENKKKLDHCLNKDIKVSAEIKILLVDDREDSLFALEQVFSNEEYRLFKANSGMEALKILLHEYDFSLILMDVRMPGMDGIETAELIYSRDKLKHIPIIFITGAEFNESFVFKGYKTGGVDYIYKPINPELLRAKVAVFVDLYRKNHLLMAHEQNLQRIADELEIKNNALAVANSELEAFTYSVSHDLRAPLRAMDGYSHILQEDYFEILDDEGKNNLKRIIKSAHKMGTLIDDLLHLSRVGRKELEKAHIDMNNLVHMVLYEFNTQIDARKVAIHVDALHSGFGDMNLIKQIWVNLISNSMKFTVNNPKAMIEIGSEKLKDEIIYYISDNGAGFDMHYYDKLFSVFQRLHSDKEFEGTGVGLAIVNRIVTRHGGRIWAKGEIGKGATFYFSLPTYL